MRTIRGRLLAMLLTGLTVVLIAGGAAVYWIAEASLIRRLDDSLRTQAQAMASMVTFDDGRFEFEFDSGDGALVPDGYFEYRTRLGKVLKQSESLAGMSLPMHGTSDEVHFGDVELPGATRGRAVWMTFRPRIDAELLQLPGYMADEYDDDEGDDEDDELLEADEDDEGTPEVGSDQYALIVTAAIDRGPTDRTLATLLAVLIGVGSIVGIMTGVLVMVGVGWGLRPLDRLREQIGCVSGRTISTRLDDAGAPGELVPVYRELNQMLDRVELTLDRERSFANAAAHELRTPLAELRSTAEVAIRWPDPQRATAALQELLSIGSEMERLVEALLLISRGDATALNGQADMVPVASVVHDCLERANGSIDAKELTLTVNLHPDSTLEAPRDAMEIIVRNLIDNAVRYTPPRGTITITDGPASNGSPLLTVENGPVSLGESDLPHLFEPFWRIEASRTDRQHVGLGLTVVDRVARSIGLRVDAGLVGDRLRIRLGVCDADSEMEEAGWGQPPNDPQV